MREIDEEIEFFAVSATAMGSVAIAAFMGGAMIAFGVASEVKQNETCDPSSSVISISAQDTPVKNAERCSLYNQSQSPSR